MANVSNAGSPDSRMRAAPANATSVQLATPSVATPSARLASEDLGPYTPPRPGFAGHVVGSVVGWLAFLGFLLGVSYGLLWLVWVFAGLEWGLGRGGWIGLGNIVALILVMVMITATLLTMADRKWSALMQDRVGPNRARFSAIKVLGIDEMPLKGMPHIIADVLKMLFKEDFIPEGAIGSKILFNLAPVLAFGPAFCLFAVVPVTNEVSFNGRSFALQVAHVDWGILYVFGLASLAVFGTALAGWASNNKLALLGGLRASAQLVSYEVTLGLTLVGAMVAFGTLRLDEMSAMQAPTWNAVLTGAADDSLLFGWLPSWGILFQPLGCLLFLVAAMAEIKRAPFDTPEGESEIIGYFLEYSGLKSGLFLIAEYAETVVIAGIVTAIFLGGCHLPWIEPWVYSTVTQHLRDNVAGQLLATLQVFTFIVKMLAVIWVMFLVRWAFPRFRYDQIMRLGWKMMLPISLANVIVSSGVYLWGGREGLAIMGGLEWIAILAFVSLSALKSEEPVADSHSHSGSHGAGAHDTHPVSTDSHGHAVAAASH